MILGLLAAPEALGARTAPDFKLKSLDGKEISLYDVLKEGPVLLDFWATWCQPCIRALPEIQKIGSEYADRNLTVLTINEDGPRNLAKIRPFLNVHRLEFVVLLDLNATVMNAYNVNSIPTTVLIGPGGEIVYFHRGYKPGDEKELRDEIEKIVR